MSGLTLGATIMLIVGIILLYIVGLGLGIYRAWRKAQEKKAEHTKE